MKCHCPLEIAGSSEDVARRVVFVDYQWLPLTRSCKLVDEMHFSTAVEDRDEIEIAGRQSFCKQRACKSYQMRKRGMGRMGVLAGRDADSSWIRVKELEEEDKEAMAGLVTGLRAG